MFLEKVIRDAVIYTKRKTFTAMEVVYLCPQDAGTHPVRIRRLSSSIFLTTALLRATTYDAGR